MVHKIDHFCGGKNKSILYRCTLCILCAIFPSKFWRIKIAIIQSQPSVRREMKCYLITNRWSWFVLPKARRSVVPNCTDLMQRLLDREKYNNQPLNWSSVMEFELHLLKKNGMPLIMRPQSCDKSPGFMMFSFWWIVRGMCVIRRTIMNAILAHGIVWWRRDALFVTIVWWRWICCYLLPDQFVDTRLRGMS